MSNFLVLNDGTSKVLLNDGSSAVLLNGITIGMQIIGVHPGQDFIRRPELKIPVEFTFWLKSKLLRRVRLELLGEVIEKLKPGLLYTNDLRYSFQLPMATLRDKVAPALKRWTTKLELEAIIEQAENNPNEFLLTLATLIKKLEKNIDRK